MDLFPMKLSQTTLANWGSCVVPQGKHKGKTFAEVAVESGIHYRGRECTSIWAKSLCAYAYEMEIDGTAHGVNTEHDNDDGKDYDKHGGGCGVNTKHDKDHGIDYDKDHDDKDCDKHGGGYAVDGQDNDKGLRTIILKVPHDAKVTVQLP